MKTYKDTTMWLENRAKRYDTIKEIVMYMRHSEVRTWIDNDIYRLFLIDDKELEEILEFFIQQRAEEIQNEYDK
jgi:hypothetical protein